MRFPEQSFSTSSVRNSDDLCSRSIVANPPYQPPTLTLAHHSGSLEDSTRIPSISSVRSKPIPAPQIPTHFATPTVPYHYQQPLLPLIPALRPPIRYSAGSPAGSAPTSHSAPSTPAPAPSSPPRRYGTAPPCEHTPVSGTPSPPRLPSPSHENNTRKKSSNTHLPTRQSSM